MARVPAPTRLARRVGYSASDTAGQLVFCVVSFYLLKYYTDVAGLTAGAAGTVLLLARLVDAVDAPLWGIVFDRTHSRWGRSRPWFLWLCGPFAVFGILTFAVPNWSPTAKFVYAAVTYIGCGILYTGVNTPVTTILSALTSDPRERITLTSFRMVGSKLGVLFVNLTALRLVAYFGKGDDRRGFLITLPLYAAIAVALYLFAFRTLEEHPSKPKREGSVLHGFGAIRGNWPWIILFLSFLSFWVAFVARISTAPFFFQYTLRRPDLIPVANAFDFVSLASILLLPVLCRWMSKKSVCLAALFGCLAGQFVIGWALHRSGGLSLPLILTGWILGFLATGAAMSLPFSMLSDTVDYGEWKTGIRAAGLLTAIGSAFCAKAGSGLGGALPAWIMAAHGYVPNVAQTAHSLAGIELAFVWLPAIFYALAIVPLLFYGRFEAREDEIRATLALGQSQIP